MMDVLYLIPCIFYLFSFPTEDDAYNPTCSIFSICFFFILLNCCQPTCIYTSHPPRSITLHFGRKGRKKKKKAASQILIRIELKYEALLSVGNRVWKKTKVFLFVSMLLDAVKKVLWKSYLGIILWKSYLWKSSCYCIQIGPFYSLLLVPDAS